MSQWFKDQRQAYLLRLCETEGRFNRADLMTHFDISVSQASIDIREFLTANPDVLYDKTARQYRIP